MKDDSVSLVLSSDCTANEVADLLHFLEQRGTFHFPTLPNGLFSAVAGGSTDIDATGYQHVWVRDNVHIAHAHWQWGQRDKARAAIRSLITFYVTHQQRLRDILDGKVDATDPMNRPHIRFDGKQLRELDQKWSHAQNDALGALLWMARIIADDQPWTPAEQDVLDLIARYLIFISFWDDEDSGHWEEVRKVAASSIGIVCAALDAWGDRYDAAENARGRKALDLILPAECIQPGATQTRRYDSALLFLIYPYQTVSQEMADRIVSDVTTHLMGDHGVRRYLGDSYWCADYKENLAADERTADFSDNLADRDKLLKPGGEAQWCLFDPIISIHYGLRFDRQGDPADRKRQIHHLNRSLGQLTTAQSRFGAYRCPESYYRERGNYVPNDICPLLWTQANLKLALTHLNNGLRTA